MNTTDTSDKAKSQTAAILQHLNQHGKIDMPTAWKEYGCAALRSRISDLRNKHGVKIETEKSFFTSRYGHRGWYAVYVLSFSKFPAVPPVQGECPGKGS